MKKTRFVMTVDTRRCVGCHACVIACKAENKVPENYYRDWIVEALSGSYPQLSLEIRSERCNHCDHPPCVHACPTGASHISEGGAVLVTHHKCTGCKACIAACPYDCRFVHPTGYVDKCTFCSHRVQKDKNPACVEICPARALHFGNVLDSESVVARLVRTRKYKVLHPETGCKPQLYFLL